MIGWGLSQCLLIKWLLILLVGEHRERHLVRTKLEYSKQQATENAKEEVRRILGLLDTHLKTRTFLVGERVTLADITVVCTLLWLYKQVRFEKNSFDRGLTSTGEPWVLLWRPVNGCRDPRIEFCGCFHFR